jgi:thiamine-phosphate diphosphorylase
VIDLQSALRLYLVADPEHCRGDLVSTVEAAIAGGVSMVQLRAKWLSDLERFNLATKIRSVCRGHNVQYLVNDRIDIALAVGADGVHLGVSDLPIEAARSISGSGFIIGYSPESNDQLRSAVNRGADYLGIGPVFGTATKADAGSALGLEELANRVRLGGLPAVGIGGINSGNAESVINAGAAGVAVVSAILGADDPTSAARQLSRKS